ncbi:MAG: hypothetical protein U0V02_09400 [Anaerolineales bacterium]
MKQNNFNTILKNSFLIAWSLLCIGVFLVLPGREDYLHWISLGYPLPILENFREISFPTYLLKFILSLGECAIYAVCCISLGLFIFKLLRINSSDNEEVNSKLASLATQFLIGQSLFSSFFLFCATMSQLTPQIVLVSFVLGFISGAAWIKDSFTNLGVFTNTVGTRKIILILSVSILSITVLQSTSRISYDSTAIYFSDAKLTAIYERASYFTDDTFVISVLQSTTQFTALMQLFGDQPARMISWFCGIVICALSLSLGKKLSLSKNALIILLALLATSTAFLDLMGDGKVDLISGAYAISAVYWVNLGITDKFPNKTALLLSGYLAGFACVTRPFNAFLIILLILFFYFQIIILKNGFKLQNFKLLIASLIWVGLGGIGLGLYHLFLNWALLGSPLAFMSSVSNINPSSGPWDFDPNTILLSRLFYPFMVTFKNNPQSLGNISPFFLAFVPAWLAIKKIKGSQQLFVKLQSLVIAALATLILWIFLFFTIIEIRYIFFLWIIIYLPTAKIIDGVLSAEDKLIKATTNILIISTLCFIALRSLNISFGAYSLLDKTNTPQCFNAPFCEYLKPINKQASSGDRILTLGAYRYYLRPDLFACSTNHAEYIQLRELSSSKDMEEFWREVYRLGFKYIAFEKDYTVRHLQFNQVPGPENTPEWMTLIPLYSISSNELAAYQIQVKAPPITSEVFCTKMSNNGIWALQK